jgi:hypothetical protein
VLSLPSESTNRWDTIGAIWSIALAIGGTMLAYQRNGSAHGRDFLQRWLLIGWVVGVRCIAASLIVIIPLYSVLIAMDQFSEVTTWYEFLILAVIELVYYERLAHHIGDVAQRSAITSVQSA